MARKTDVVITVESSQDLRLMLDTLGSVKEEMEWERQIGTLSDNLYRSGIVHLTPRTLEPLMTFAIAEGLVLKNGKRMGSDPDAPYGYVFTMTTRGLDFISGRYDVPFQVVGGEVEGDTTTHASSLNTKAVKEVTK